MDRQSCPENTLTIDVFCSFDNTMYSRLIFDKANDNVPSINYEYQRTARIPYIAVMSVIRFINQNFFTQNSAL